MQLKASTDYGVRAVLYLAAQGETCSSKDIAEDMGIPRDYLIQLAQLLRNAGVIEARPGKHGGYRLAKPPAEISVLDVLNAVSGDSKKSRRARSLGVSASDRGADARDRFVQASRFVGESVDSYLKSLTVDKLVELVYGDGGADKLVAESLRAEAARLEEGSSRR